MTSIPNPRLRFFTSSNILAENITSNGAFLSQNNNSIPVIYETLSNRHSVKYDNNVYSIGHNTAPPSGSQSFLYFLPSLYSPPTDEMTLNFFWRLIDFPPEATAYTLFSVWRNTYPDSWLQWIPGSGQLIGSFGQTVDNGPTLAPLSIENAKKWNMITYVLEQNPSSPNYKKITLYINGTLVGGNSYIWSGNYTIYPIAGIGVGAYRNTTHGVRSNFHKMELWEEVLSSEQINQLYLSSTVIQKNTGIWTSDLLDPSKASLKNTQLPTWGTLFLERNNPLSSTSMNLDILDENSNVLINNPTITTTKTSGTIQYNTYNLSNYSFASSPIQLKITLENPVVGTKTSVQNIRLTMKEALTEQTVTKSGVVNLLDNLIVTPEKSDKIKFGINQNSISSQTTELVSPVTPNFDYEIIEIDEKNERIKVRFRTRSDEPYIPNNTLIDSLSVNSTRGMFGGVMYKPINFKYESIPSYYNFDVTFRFQRKSSRTSLTDDGVRHLIERTFKTPTTYTPIQDFTLFDAGLYIVDVTFPQDEILSYWKLDELDGMTVKDHFNRFNGTVSRAGMWKPPGQGKINGYLEMFFGDDPNPIDNVQLGNINLQRRQDWSVGCWYRGNVQLAAQGTIYNENHGTGSNDALFVKLTDGDFRYAVGIYNGSTWTVGRSNYYTPDINTWHFFTVTKKGTQLQFYSDGEPFGSTTLSFSISDRNPNKSQFGQRRFSDPWYDPFRGDMDEVFIFARALTPTEVKDIYNGGAGLQVDGVAQVNAGENYGPVPITSANVNPYEPYLTTRSYLPENLGNLMTYHSIGLYDSTKMISFGNFDKPILKTDEYSYIFTMRYRPLTATHNIG